MSQAKGGVFVKGVQVINVSRQRNFSQQRSSSQQRNAGSVLLIAVVLLLILAIMGTAYLATTRSDRVSSSAANQNTQIDTFSDSAKDLVVSRIVNSLYAYLNPAAAGTAVYSPRLGDNYSYQNTKNAHPASYHHGDSPQTIIGGNIVGFNSWLADRFPTLPDTTANASSPNNLPQWNAITEPLFSNVFEDPRTQLQYNVLDTSAGATDSLPVQPTYYTAAGGVNYPAFYTHKPAASGFNTAPIVAGDATGAGVADCALERIPGSFGDNTIYYLGLRVIDNSAAINVNTAGDNSSDPLYSTPSASSVANVPNGSFPTTVGLAQWLNGGSVGADNTALTNFRFSGDPTVAPTASNVLTPVDDTWTPRFGGTSSDFFFQTFGESLYHNMSRRVNNPGLHGPANYVHYRAFGDADGSALAFHFCLLDVSSMAPSASTTGNPVSFAEQVLQNSLFLSAPNYSAAAYSSVNLPWTSYPEQYGSTTTAINYWYRDNFNAPTPGGSATPHLITNLRPYLVTRNGISNSAPVTSAVIPTAANPQITVPSVAGTYTTMVPWGDRGRWQPNVYYNVGDVVTYAYTPGYGAAPTSGLPTEYGYNYNELCSGVFYCTTAHLSASTAAPTTTAPPDIASSPWSRTPPAGYTSPTYVAAPRANINTALFPELYRAFWSVFSGAASVSPNFKGLNNVVRDTPTFFPSGTTPLTEMVAFRAAVAAVNAETLRAPDPDASLTGVAAGTLRTAVARQVPLFASGTATSYANIYGTTPQPYITEVYAQTDALTNNGGTNASGYVAIELYNPYDFDIPLVSASIPGTDSAWVLASLSRPSVAGTPKTLTATVQLDGADFGLYDPTGNGNAFVPSHGYLLLENYSAHPPAVGSDASYRPTTSGLPATGDLAKSNTRHINTSNGATAYLYPGGYNPANSGDPDRRTDATGTTGIPMLNVLYVHNLANVFGNELIIMKRRHADGTSSTGTDGSYSWNDSTPATSVSDYVPVDSFNFASITAASATSTAAQGIYYSRVSDGNLNTANRWHFVYPGPYTGTDLTAGVSLIETFDPHNLISMPEPFTSTSPALVTTFGADGTNNPTSNVTSTVSTYTAQTIQLASSRWAGLNRPTAAGSNTFPFGGYARNGDILETPFIGAYFIATYDSSSMTTTINEVNTVSVDSSLAYDGAAVTAPETEQIGRFCPLQASPDYDFARRLFDYVTVQSPHDDYLPNTDPNRYPYKPGASPATTLPPLAVANSNSAVTANTDAENDQLVQGLVNASTAPFAVLRQLPLVVDNTGAINAPNNDALAAAIVTYRQANGPFTSIFDLNKVPQFQSAEASIAFTGASTYPQGDTADPASGTPGQFDEQYLQVTRLSNILTTRSDVFTVYGVVEGWLNAPGVTPKPVITRRFAFTIDRSTVGPQSKSPRIVNIPNN